MTANHGYSDKDDPDAELRHQAWSEAREQVHRECWIGILQKCSDLQREWRHCSVGSCRRLHRCSDPRLLCREARYRISPPPDLMPDERARAAYDLKQALQRERAKRKARGETSDIEDRIARLAEQKLASLRAAHLGER